MSDEPEKPLTGEDAERQPTRPDLHSPPYRSGADAVGPGAPPEQERGGG